MWPFWYHFVAVLVCGRFSFVTVLACGCLDVHPIDRQRHVSDRRAGMLNTTLWIIHFSISSFFSSSSSSSEACEL